MYIIKCSLINLCASLLSAFLRRLHILLDYDVFGLYVIIMYILLCFVFVISSLIHTFLCSACVQCIICISYSSLVL